MEENISSNGVASNWLRNPDLAPTLKSLTEEATMSDRIITTWKLLSSGCKIGIDGGKADWLNYCSYFHLLFIVLIVFTKTFLWFHIAKLV